LAGFRLDLGWAHARLAAGPSYRHVRIQESLPDEYGNAGDAGTRYEHAIGFPMEVTMGFGSTTRLTLGYKAFLGSEGYYTVPGRVGMVSRRAQRG
jgi:hypothetical protein